MRRTVLLLLFALAMIGAGNTEYIPGGSSGVDTDPRTVCQSGTVVGGDYSSSTGTYGWICGNNSSLLSGAYGGSAVSGSGRVADWDAATTAGGNAYRINCTGSGVGVTQDGTTVNSATDLALGGGTISAGSTTTVIEDSDATYAVNALRGYHLFVTSGAANGESRQIVSNTATAITLGTALTAGAPAAADTYSVHNLYVADCYDDGEVVILNAMADAMIAQDLVRPGGIVYWPDLSDGKATAYVHTGCGRKGMGSGTTAYVGNNCPVLQRQNSGHYQRSMELGFRNVMHDLGPRDTDLFNEKTSEGRQGGYLLNNTGGPQPQNTYYDPSDGTAFGDARSMSVGGSTINGFQTCVPISTTDPSCNVSAIAGTANSQQVYIWWQTVHSLGQGISGNAVKSAVNNADVTDPRLLCLNDTVDTATVGGALTNLGVCQEDIRIQCTVAGDAARTSTTAGGCQFDGGAIDLGPCLSYVDALDYYNDTPPAGQASANNYLYISQNQISIPATTYGTSRDGAFGRVAAVPGASCTTGGGTVEIDMNGSVIGSSTSSAQWTLPMGSIDAASGASTTGRPSITWLHPDWFSPDGGIRGGVIMASGWLGRDVDGDGSNDPTHGDCFTAGDADTGDDSPACDTKAVTAFMNIAGAGIYDSVVAYGGLDSGVSAGSWFDSSDYGDERRLYNTIITEGKRGRVADWTCVDTRNVTFLDNFSLSGSTSSSTWSSVLTPLFTSRCGSFNDMKFIQNAGADVIGTPTEARHGEMRDLQLIGNYAQRGQIALATGGSLVLENVQISGGSWPGVWISNYYGAITNITMRKIRGFGFTASSPVASDRAKALIDFTALGFAAAGQTIPTNVARGFIIDNVWLESATSNAALVAFDDPADAGADQVAPIATLRSSTVITNSGIDCVEGATGCEPVIVVTHTGTGETTAGDTGIWNEAYMPVMDNIYEDGVAKPDQPWPQQTAATCGDCDDAGRAGSICHISDASAANTCTDAGADGVLDTGTAGTRAVCQCEGSTTTWVPYGG